MTVDWYSNLFLLRNSHRRVLPYRLYSWSFHTRKLCVCVYVCIVCIELNHLDITFLPEIRLLVLASTTVSQPWGMSLTFWNWITYVWKLIQTSYKHKAGILFLLLLLLLDRSKIQVIVSFQTLFWDKRIINVGSRFPSPILQSNIYLCVCVHARTCVCSIFAVLYENRHSLWLMEETEYIQEYM